MAGVVLNRSRFQQHEVVHHIESLTNAFLAPVFFATAGLRVDLSLLADRRVLAWAGVVMAVAIVAKFAGAFIGARLAGQSRRAAVALGAGLNARGALEIVIASVGLSLGVFSETAYTVVVIVPLVTSVFAAASLRLAVRDWRGSPAEQERLEREEALSRNLVVRSSRLLLASRAEPASIAAAQLMHFAWPVQVPATVISVTSESLQDGSYHSGGSRGAQWPDITVIRNVLDGRDVDHRQVRAASEAGAVVANAIVAEARLGYGAICVGVAGRHEGQLYSPMVDELLLQSRLPVVIVRRARDLTTPLPGAYTRAVVPVTGTRSSAAAQEVAFGVSGQLGTEVVLTHVVQRQRPEIRVVPERLVQSRLGKRVLGDEGGRSGLARRVLGEGASSGLARRVLGEGASESARQVTASLMESARARGAEMGVDSRTLVTEGSSPASKLVSVAEEVQADLVVLGASLRNVDGRPVPGPYRGNRLGALLSQRRGGGHAPRRRPLAAGRGLAGSSETLEVQCSLLRGVVALLVGERRQPPRRLALEALAGDVAATAPHEVQFLFSPGDRDVQQAPAPLPWRPATARGRWARIPPPSRLCAQPATPGPWPHGR